MEQDAFWALHDSPQGICVLNWEFKKVYENKTAKALFSRQCPGLYRQLKKICQKAGETVPAGSNPFLHHSGVLRYRCGAVAFSCLFLGQGTQTNVYILFDYLPKALLPTADNTADITITPREKEIVQAVALGKTNKEISRLLGIGLETVKSHIRNLFAKLQVKSRTELVGKVLKNPADS
ncbi:MAG: helix-turn-helix transcriptional regulator [Veillonellales bacterium]